MKKYFYLPLIFLIVLYFLNSCSPSYIPNVVNVPLLTNKNEFQLNLSGGLSGSDIQIAYAPTKNLALILNFCGKDNTNDSSTNFHKHSFLEGGVGVYHPLGNQVRFELFGGYGYGISEGQYTFLGNTNFTKVGYHRFFVQPNLGFSSAFLDFALTPRLVFLSLKPFDFLYSSLRYAFIEPVFTTRIGLKYIFLTSQIGLSIPISTFGAADLSDYQPFIFSFGICIKLFKIYNSKPRYN